MIPENRNAGLVFLALVVIASGCAHTGPSGDTAAKTQAVQVSNFSAIPDTVFESQEPTLRLTLKNTGDFKATDVRATLFNVPFGQPSQREWGVESRTFNFGTLRPANEEAGLPATPKERTKTVTPPDLSDGEVIPYDFMARIFFKYRTRATTEIQLMGQQRFRETGQARARPAIENTDGPIQMEVRTRTPIVFYEDGTTSSNLCLIVRNEGQGTPTWPQDRTQEDVVQIKIRSSGSMSFETIEGQPNRLELVGKRGIKCYRVTGFEDFSSTDIQRTIPVTFEAVYGYKKETQTSITVKGRGGSSSSTTSGGSDNPDDGGSPPAPPS
ncbi:MAG: hypothetical protein ABEJ64_04210 [Candidatus Nanohaloarchaea archaeon]